MGFLNDGMQNISVEDVRRLIRDEVSLQTPAIPAGLVGLADGDIPLLRPPAATTNQLLTYSQATGTWSAKSAVSSMIGTDAGSPGTPVVTLVAGPAYLQASWPRVTGTNDPVVYQVFIRAGSAPTTADATFLVGTTTALSLVINCLADGTTRLRSDTVYHVKVLALSVLTGGATGSASIDVSLAPGALDGTVTTISHLDAGNITVGDLDGARIQTNLLATAKAVISQLSALQVDAGSITAGSFASGAADPRVIHDGTGLYAHDAAGNTTFLVDSVTGTFKGAVYLDQAAGLVVVGGVSQPLTAPALSVVNGGSLSGSTTYFLTYSWANAQQLALANQSNFEADPNTGTPGLTKLVSTETYSLDTGAGNFHSGLGALKIVTAATSGSGVALGAAAASVTNDAPVVGSQAYTFAVWIKQTAGGSNLSLEVAWKDSSGTVLRTDTQAAFAPGTTFAQKVFNVTSHASAVYATCRVKTTANTATTLWLDDAQLEPGSSATTAVIPHETAFYVVVPSKATTVSNKILQAVLPAAPAGASYARVYMDTATFAQGAGHLHAIVAPSTTTTTTVQVSAFVSTAAASPASLTVSAQGAFGTTAAIQPAQAVDSTGARYGWTLEGNGRIRFVGPTANSQFWLYDEFLYASGSWGATNTTTGVWLSAFSGTAAIVQAGSSTNADPGIVQLATGTTTTGTARIRTNTSFSLGVARIRFSVYFMLDNTAGASNSFNILMGLDDVLTGAPLASAAHGIVFQLNSDTTNVLTLAVADGSALVTQTSGVTLTNGAWHFAEFEVDAARTAVNWWVDGTKQTAITTHIPAAGASNMAAILGITKTATGAGTLSRTLNVDTCTLFGDYVSG